MGREVKYTKGENLEKRLDSTERTLQQFSRRLCKTVGIKIPPVPVSTYCYEPDDNGVFFRYMFPSSGRIETAAVKVDQWPEDQKTIEIIADVYNEDQSTQHFFELKNITNFFNMNSDVVAGLRFELRTKSLEQTISGIWVAFLYTIEERKSKLHEMLVEKVENQDEGTDS